MKKALFTLASALLLLNAVMAANIDPVASVTGLQGSAVVARGDASMPLKQGMKLMEGDKVAVLDKSSVKLTYADCSIGHQQNTTVNVSAAAPCALGSEFGIGVVEAAGAAGGGGAAGAGAAGAGAAGAGAAGAGAAGAGIAGAGAAGAGIAGAGIAGAAAAVGVSTAVLVTVATVAVVDAAAAAAENNDPPASP